ncbi:hypothetical protein BU14_0973s0005 [Porphyra umbilicalis]|uniref:Uncharacterized protein n=1 Tax=Porphyra umbilicalis TaxID=2786 RepID=A0A1X6NN60_PORUM|nr:hypothetical protein BU14_0973s0005 [Porphyra umbilicalis]|eukprot:OSX69980.1 hypothetical protein BU14_0973s0005 [Porphyra umbilicalis]
MKGMPASRERQVIGGRPRTGPSLHMPRLRSSSPHVRPFQPPPDKEKRDAQPVAYSPPAASQPLLPPTHTRRPQRVALHRQRVGRPRRVPQPHRPPEAAGDRPRDQRLADGDRPRRPQEPKRGADPPPRHHLRDGVVAEDDAACGRQGRIRGKPGGQRPLLPRGEHGRAEHRAAAEEKGGDVDGKKGAKLGVVRRHAVAGRGDARHDRARLGKPPLERVVDRLAHDHPRTHAERVRLPPGDDERDAGNDEDEGGERDGRPREVAVNVHDVR